jgi:hypothetical protein
MNPLDYIDIYGDAESRATSDLYFYQSSPTTR